MTSMDTRSVLLLEALRAGNRAGCFSLVREWERENMSSGTLYNNVLFPALSELGRLWERNQIGIADEHIASEIVRQIIAYKASQIETSVTAKGTAIVGCVPDEQHDIPALALANLLEEDGWQTRFFGASVPRADIVDLAARLQPGLACLVVKTVPRMDAAIRLIAELRAAAPAMRVMVGGIHEPALRTVLKPHVDAFADCPVSAVETANTLAAV